jgi:sugar/nucleoside kinase (ribokinase family)
MTVQGKGSEARDHAVRSINRPREVVAISLLWSQTIDLFAARVAPSLRPQLEWLRATAPDGVKVAVESIDRDEHGWRVAVDGAGDLLLPDAAVGDVSRMPGGGLCNLARDLKVIQATLGTGLGNSDVGIPPIEHLSWADAADEFGAAPVAGRSRTSLVLRDEGFDKLILTERGPHWDEATLDPFAVERDFYAGRNAFIFIGQEPLDTPKFDMIRKAKLGNPSLKVFWLVGGNQLKRLYTEYRDFLSVVDLISLNLSEAANFFGFEQLRRRHRDASELRKMVAREISRRALELGASHVVITDGAKGASLARKGRGGRVEFVYSPLIHENIVQVDPSVREDTGCGDSFAAAIAAYFLASPERFKLNEAANFAHYIAGIVYQRRRPNLTEEDRHYIELAHRRAQDCGPLVSSRVNFDRTRCEIRPAQMAPRGPRRHVLVLLLGGDPTDPAQPHVTGAAAAVERLAEMMRSNHYPPAPLIRIVPRVTTDRSLRDTAWMHRISQDEMETLVAGGGLCNSLGNLDSEPRNGVRWSDIAGHEGVTLLRVGLWEAIEVLSSEDFAVLFEDIKFWHFATENVDERIIWHARQWGITREQGQEIVRQSLREYVIEHMGPQVRFGHARAANLEEFHQEMTDQLILRIDALLAGIFRSA